jgi:hydroxymethylpyrimidine pyrophosphatase-like HAD family hydrolase
MMKRSLIFLLPVLLAAGCQNKNTFTVRGVIKEPGNKTVLLNRIDVNTLVLIDSCEIASKGKFSFRVKADEPGFYQLGYSDSEFITILAEPGEKIDLAFNGKSLSQDYSVSGSDGSEKVRMLDMRLNDAKRKLDSLRVIYEKASGEPGFDEKRLLLENEFNNIIKELRKKNIEFIITNTRSMASIKALYQRIDENTYVLYDPKDLQYLKIVSDSLGRYYPGSKNVKALAEDVKKELNQMTARQIQNLANSSPEVKLDPDLNDTNGNRITLSSLKGKVVLLTFWSVDSKECIAENLQFKNIYKIYNKKGFEIYQINLDESEEKWKAEVKFDELPWINTREDDPLNPKNAILFNVKALPANYLFDRDGTLIGMNLHGRSLQIRLNQLFNN